MGLTERQETDMAVVELRIFRPTIRVTRMDMVKEVHIRKQQVRKKVERTWASLDRGIWSYVVRQMKTAR